MTKWLIVGIIAVLILLVAISEMLEEKWYEGYMEGMSEHEKMMRKEKEDGVQENFKILSRL